MDDYTDPDILAKQSQAVAPKRGWVAPLVIGGMFILIAGAGFAYWLNARHFATTDDAFVDGNISQVSAQISGRVMALRVVDNQEVAAGQVLLELDHRDQDVRLAQAEAQADQAAASLAQAQATVPARQADLDQSLANARVSEADVRQAQHDLARYSAINPRAISAQMLDQARTTLNSAQARLDAAQHAARGMRAQMAVAAAQIKSAEAALRVAQADVENAKLQLAYTKIVAPAAGRVTRRTVELGNYVQPGQSLLAIVQPQCWVTANFKEAQLNGLRPGLPATVTIDAYPDEALPAHVDSLQSGTGSVFSSLPAENATGNYVKIVQRLPVKLTFDGDACARLHLAPGLSAEPKVRVR